MKSTVLKSVFLALSFLAVVACGKKSDDSATINGAREMRAGPSNLPSGQAATAGSNYAMVTQANQQTLDEMAKVLVSPTVKPETVGAIQRIELRGKVYVNPQTGAVYNNSTISLNIVDSYVGQSTGDGQTIQPIFIEVGGATGAAANYNANLTFADQYGRITITGTYNASTFQGTVSFVNTSGTGYNGKNSGTLGTFSIATCAFFVCQ